MAPSFAWFNILLVNAMNAANALETVCVRESYHTFLEGRWEWQYFNETLDSAVYLCIDCKVNPPMWLFVFRWENGYDDWFIGETPGVNWIVAYCPMGSNTGEIWKPEDCPSWTFWDGTLQQWVVGVMTMDNCVTNEPTITPTQIPSESPSSPPTHSPTAIPTSPPTNAPFKSPTAIPSNGPTDDPTIAQTTASTMSTYAEQPNGELVSNVSDYTAVGIVIVSILTVFILFTGALICYLFIKKTNETQATQGNMQTNVEMTSGQPSEPTHRQSQEVGVGGEADHPDLEESEGTDADDVPMELPQLPDERIQAPVTAKGLFGLHDI